MMTSRKGPPRVRNLIGSSWVLIGVTASRAMQPSSTPMRRRRAGFPSRTTSTRDATKNAPPIRNCSSGISRKVAAAKLDSRPQRAGVRSSSSEAPADTAGVVVAATAASGIVGAGGNVEGPNLAAAPRSVTRAVAPALTASEDGRIFGRVPDPECTMRAITSLVLLLTLAVTATAQDPDLDVHHIDHLPPVETWNGASIQLM